MVFASKTIEKRETTAVSKHDHKLMATAYHRPHKNVCLWLEMAAGDSVSIETNQGPDMMSIWCIKWNNNRTEEKRRRRRRKKKTKNASDGIMAERLAGSAYTTVYNCWLWRGTPLGAVNILLLPSKFTFHSSQWRFKLDLQEKKEGPLWGWGVCLLW